MWGQLGMNQKVSVVLGGLAVLAGLAATMWFSSRTDYSLLYGKLDDAESSKVISALDDNKVAYKLNGSSIYVPTDKVYLMRMRMAEKGIPRTTGGVGYELFDKSNFGISDFVQQKNWMRAIQGELERTISQVDGIESTRVMVVIPESRILTDNSRKPTASVFLRVRGNAALPQSAVTAIQFLVANSVEGLQPDAVAVVDNMAHKLTDGMGGDVLLGSTTKQLTARISAEQYFAKKVEDLLEKSQSRSEFVVKVSTEMNFDTLTREETKYDPDVQMIRRSEIRDESTESLTGSQSTAQSGIQGNTTTSLTSGVPSGEANTNSPSATKNKTTKKDSKSDYEFNKIVSKLAQEPGLVTRMTASVSLRLRYEGSGAERKAVPRSTDELDKIRRLVRSALGIEEVGGKKELVVVEEIPFNEAPALEIASQMQKQEKKNMIFDILRLVMYPGLALIIMLILWKQFKGTKMDDLPAGMQMADFGAEIGGLEALKRAPRSENGGYEKGDDKSRVVTVDVLNQLIRENPQNMTQAVRAWMSRKSR